MTILRPKLTLWTALVASVMFLSAAHPASADYLWGWSYKCNAGTFSSCKGGSGLYTSTMTAQGPSGNPYYLLTGITGTMEGNTITALLAPSSFNLSNDNKISAFSGPSKGTPYSHDPSHTVTGIAFLINNEPATQANECVLAQNFQNDFLGDFTQILLNPGDKAILNTDFSVKFEGISGPIGSTAPEPGGLLLITMGCLIIGCASRKLSN